MGGLMKIVVFTAPVLAAVFVYVMFRQEAHDARMDTENLRFEREWNEWAADSSFSTPQARKRALARAEKADAAIAESEAREERARGKSTAMTSALEKAIEEAEKDKGREDSGYER
ncbi:MAG: hypothetical protein HY804_07625 [Nitrospinae bacterium]|nr:hypothetical protein [Nitrospinota bacterium]